MQPGEKLYLHARAAACNEVAGGGHQIASSKWRENWPRNGLRAPVANIRYSALNSPEVVCSSHSPDRPRMLVTRFVRPEPPLSERGPAAFHSAHGGKKWRLADRGENERSCPPDLPVRTAPPSCAGPAHHAFTGRYAGILKERRQGTHFRLSGFRAGNSRAIEPSLSAPSNPDPRACLVPTG